MAKINRKILCDATFKKGAFKRLSDRSQLCYCKLCVYADDEGAILDFDGLMGYYRFEPEDLKPLIENNFFYHRQPDDCDEYLLVENFFEANNNLPSQGANFTQSIVHEDIELNFKVVRQKQGGDGHYYPKKTPVDGVVKRQQSTSNNGVSDGIDDSITTTSQEQPVTEYSFSDNERDAVINECPQEYFDGDISSIEKALNECLKHDGLNITNIVMATNKYYNPKLKSTTEKKLGKIKMLHEFLSDSTLVLAAYHMN